MRRAILAAAVLLISWQLVARVVEFTRGPEPAPPAVSAVAPEPAPPRADRERVRKPRHVRRARHARSAPSATSYDDSDRSFMTPPPPDRPRDDGAAMIAAHQRAEMARIASDTYEREQLFESIMNP